MVINPSDLLYFYVLLVGLLSLHILFRGSL